MEKTRAHDGVDGGLRIVEADGILTVTVDRPQRRNALTLRMLDEICDAFTREAANETIRFAILTGAGDKAFAAGGDLAELDAIRDIAAARAMAERGKRALDAVREFPAPVICALNGAALGGGAELALACDMRVAARHVQLGFIQSRLAISPAWGGAVALFDHVGYSTAIRLLARAEILNAEDAQRLGLIDCLASPGEELRETLEEFLKPLRTQAPHVLRGIKRQGIASRHEDRATRLELETCLLAELWVHPAHWAAAEKALKK